MNDGIGLAEVLLGLPGFRVLDVVEDESEVVIRVETTAARAFCRPAVCGLSRRTGCASTCAIRPVGRPAGWCGASDGGAAGAGVSGTDVDRGLRACRRAGGADPSGRSRGVPPSR